MNILFQGVLNTENIYTSNIAYEFLSGKGNLTDRQLGRWQPGSGQNATYPRLAINSGQNNMVTSDYWLKDASYIRLKTLEIGYTIPSSLIKKVGISNFSCYVNGYNLITWENIDFIDPEAGTNGTVYPNTRIWSFGLNIGF